MFLLSYSVQETSRSCKEKLQETVKCREKQMDAFKKAGQNKIKAFFSSSSQPDKLNANGDVAMTMA